MIAPWAAWEDWRAGMYRPSLDPVRQADSVRLLGDVGWFAEAAREMLREWPTAARQNLAYMWSGRNAWLGQATCCYAHGATSADTRVAWGSLSNRQQAEANQTARMVRAQWEKEAVDAQAVLDY